VADPADVVYLDATVVDDGGNVVPTSATELHFAVAGPARIVGVDNGNNSDHDAFQAEKRQAYEGRAVVVVTANAPRSVTVRVSAAGFPDVTATLNAGAASLGPDRGRTVRSF